MNQDRTDAKEKERWTRLLAWMQTKGLDTSKLCVEPRTRRGVGRGLFVTRTLYPSQKPFLVIPAKALLNIRTLSSVYPSIPLEGFSDNTSSERLVLNGTQLLSIHLVLYRPIGDSPSKDPRFGPYIDSLPKEFDSHPLSWIVKEKLGYAETHELNLLRQLPPSVMNELQGVAKRFWCDWDSAERAKVEHLEELTGKNEFLFDIHDFLWGWLIVNSRSLYSQIFQRRLPFSNLTLCPLIDYANHTKASNRPRAIWKDAPKHAQSHRGSELSKAHDYIFLPPERVVNEGEELFLKYGEHSNRTFFVEYGFVDEDSVKEVDVSELVGMLIENKSAANLIKELLPEVAGQYMNDLEFYADPSPSHPSWGLSCVLRLINLEFPSKSHLSPDSLEAENIMKPWRNVVLGEADIVSDANETLVRRDLETICETISCRSSEAIRRLEEDDSEDYVSKCGWYEWARSCVVKLWREEAEVAQSIHDSLTRGRAL